MLTVQLRYDDQPVRYRAEKLATPHVRFVRTVNARKAFICTFTRSITKEK
jgi:hypothetical protein